MVLLFTNKSIFLILLNKKYLLLNQRYQDFIISIRKLYSQSRYYLVLFITKLYSIKIL